MAKVESIARCPEHGLHGERRECFVCGGPVDQVPVALLGLGDVVVPSWVLMSAFRYALGRRSYIVGDTIDLLRAHRGDVGERAWDTLVVGEIRSAVAAGIAGSASDAAAWTALADELEADPLGVRRRASADGDER